MKKIILSLLLLSLCILPVTATTVTADTIRVGLYYGDSKLTSANLASSNGAGYEFGYYQNKTSFVPLAYTTETEITMVIGSTVYLSGNQFSTSGSGSVLGVYHALHSAGYENFEAAFSVADTLAQGFVAWIDGDFQVRSGHFTSSSEATSHANAVGGLTAITGTSGYSINIVKTGTTELIFQFDGGSSKSLGVEQDLTGDADPQVWFKNILYRGGFQYQRIGQGDMVVSNILPIETYLRGVVPFEMSGSWPLEAQKAQAVSARTYAVLQATRVTHSGENFDLCNTAHCQVYYGNGGPVTATPTSLSDQAVAETAHTYLWYGTSLAETYYSSSHGGASEAVSNIWGSDQSKYPYLTGVIDPYEQLASSINSYSDWSISFTKGELTALLQNQGMGSGTQVKALETTYSETGNVIKLAVYWDNGGKNTLGPTELRYSNWLALPSIHFVINDSLPTGGSTGGGGSSNSNGNIATPSFDDIYGISSAGIHTISENPYVITGTGTISPLSEESTPDETPDQTPDSSDSTILQGSHYVEGNTYSFNGSGWGHNIGMSQFGAYAMAYYEGFTYDEILEFYFPGTNVARST
ncbi:MAG: SpoIID/LytB domain-containing protein [Eubacteriales bacterium]